MKVLLATATFLTTSALAQAPVTQFPEGATALSAEALTAAISDRVFRARPSTGPLWRMQFNANGYFYANVGNFADNGKWTVKDSTLCTEGRQIRAFCNEFQVKEGTLYMKRESGEVLRFEPW